MANERTLAYLAQFGLNGNDILQEGWDDNGYLAIRYTPDGKRTFDPVTQEIDSGRHEWPGGFDVAEFRSIWKEETGQR